MALTWIFTGSAWLTPSSASHIRCVEVRVRLPSTLLLSGSTCLASTLASSSLMLVAYREQPSAGDQPRSRPSTHLLLLPCQSGAAMRGIASPGAVAGLLQEGFSPALARHAARALACLLDPAQRGCHCPQQRTAEACGPGWQPCSAAQACRLSWQPRRGFAAEPAYAPEQEGEEGIEQVRARIFGSHIGNNQRSGRKVLRRALKGEQIVSWYQNERFVPMAKQDPLFVDPDIERCAWGGPVIATACAHPCACAGCAGCKQIAVRLLARQHAEHLAAAPYTAVQGSHRPALARRRAAKAEKLRRRGKGPPKKGQGKRATKAKRR